jgi:hypothetical protein
MKKIITLLSCLALLQYNAKAQITLTQSNFGKLSTYNVRTTNAINTIEYAGSNLYFRYDTIATSPAGQVSYNIPTDPFFTSMCDAYYPAQMVLGGFYYDIDYYFSTTAASYSQNAIRVPQQGYNITAATGGATDSLKFPEQKYILPVGREILKFPATAGYKNINDSRRAVNFNISVAAYGLNNAPAQHVAHVLRNDTITGWGKMRVYTPNGGSKPYDILIMLSQQQQVDSFYLAGAPAPTALLTAFGQTQGQITNVNNRIYYFRENRAAPLMLVFLNNDLSAFTGIDIDADSLALPTSIDDLSKENYTTIVYPNPANTSINIDVINTTITEATYTIIDFAGKVVAKANANKNGNRGYTISTDNIPNGNYNLIINGKNNIIASEQISIQH